MCTVSLSLSMFVDSVKEYTLLDMVGSLLSRLVLIDILTLIVTDSLKFRVYFWKHSVRINDVILIFRVMR